MQNDLEILCNEIESKMVNNSDLTELLLKNITDIENDEVRIMHSTLSTLFDKQQEVLKLFTDFRYKNANE